MKSALFDKLNASDAVAQSTSSTNEGKLWGGRFREPPSPALEVLSKSTQFDWRLAEYDILGSKAHSLALHKAGILSDDELKRMQSALDSMLEDVESGKLQPAETDEDVHGAMERILLERAGAEVGGKLRAGRSRNDQIATLIRMFLKDEAKTISSLTLDLLTALANQSKEHLGGKTDSEVSSPTVMPGRTHLQSAQPVLLSHHLMSHAWAILRDLDRLHDWKHRANLSPYGAGALAGSTLGLDANLVAKELGFSGAELNSIDATASRDVIAEFQFILTMLAINLSRLAEEICIWNTKEFDFVRLHDSYSTGSSIMPQKKNPDIAELTRGKSGRIIGNLTGLLATLKGLPLAYNRDLQEDKEPVFDTIDQLKMILPAFSGMIATAEFNREKMAEAAPKGFSLATDIAEMLVKDGVPFREAHEISGAAVSLAEEKDCELNELTEEDFAQLSPESVAKTAINPKMLTAENSVKLRNNINGTAPARVQEQLINLTKKINDFRNAK